MKWSAAEIQAMKEAGFTQDEAEVFVMSAQLHNKVLKLPEMHSADKNDLVYAIHLIQNIVISRPAYRVYSAKAAALQDKVTDWSDYEGNLK